MMDEETRSRIASRYGNAIDKLGAAGILAVNPFFRDAHSEVTFAESRIDVTGSSLANRTVSDVDSARFFGHLLAIAAERGFRPAELLAIGMAAVLREPDQES